MSSSAPAIVRPEDEEYVTTIVERLRSSRTKGELGIIVSEAILLYSVFDMQVIGGGLNYEIQKLPQPYRRKVARFLRDQIFGPYHSLLVMYRSGDFARMTGLIPDPETYLEFCTMIPHGCLAWDENDWKGQYDWHPKYRLFYYLVSAFTMFIEEKPGHPVGMPFPGGYVVEKRKDGYWCPIREKEKDIFFSICNFCPAKQMKDV